LLCASDPLEIGYPKRINETLQIVVSASYGFSPNLRQWTDSAANCGRERKSSGDTSALSSHELRRFFAVSFIWANEEGDLPALRQHMRHIDIEMTMRYVLNRLRGTALSGEQRRLTVHVMSKIMLGKIPGHGRYGEYLVRLASRMRVQAMSRKRFAKFVENLQQRHGVLLRNSPWGYCAWMSKNAKQAKCRDTDAELELTGPNDANRMPKTCADCINFLNHSNFLFFWEGELERARSELASMPDLPVWRAAAACKFETAFAQVTKFRAELGLPPPAKLQEAGD
jgi:hypothetical protein